MNKKILLRTMLLISSLMLFSFTSNNRNYQTECVSIETDGYLALKIWKTKKGQKYKPEQARKDAIYAILYSGISGANGCQTQPSLLTNDDAITKFKNIEKDFFRRNGMWATFTRSSTTETTVPTTITDKNWKVYQISVAKNKLRKFLEDKKIINALNNGF